MNPYGFHKTATTTKTKLNTILDPLLIQNTTFCGKKEHKSFTLRKQQVTVFIPYLNKNRIIYGLKNSIPSK